MRNKQSKKKVVNKELFDRRDKKVSNKLFFQFGPIKKSKKTPWKYINEKYFLWKAN